jgi:hypothetical protein
MLTLDGQPMTAPSSITGVVRMRRTLGAPVQQSVGGRSYAFVAWSDGGASTHTISTPGASTTYTATYAEVGGSGDVDVVTTTSGSSPDPDGFVVVGDESVQRAIGSNGTVRFTGVGAGPHSARLDGVAPNCAVSGPNPRTVNVTRGSLTTVTFAVNCNPIAPPPPTGSLRISGAGGGGTVTLELEATDLPAGRVRVVDASILRPAGTPASATADPTVDVATGLVTFTRTSAACVTLGWRARLDTGELVDLTLDLCDNGASGAGNDSFVIRVPAYGYAASQTVTQGDFSLTSQ